MDNIWKRGLKKALTCLLDIVFLLAAYTGAIVLFTYLRRIPGGFFAPFIKSIPLMAMGNVLIFFAFRIYRDLWGYISMMDIMRLALASGLSAFWGYVAMRFVRGVWASPTIGVTAFYLFLTMTVGVRLVPSFFSTARRYITWKTIGKDERPTLLIVGAGEAAAALIKDQQHQGKGGTYRIVGIVDDNPSKQKHALRSIPILGASQDIPTIVKGRNIQEIIIAIPSATAQERRHLIGLCSPTGAKVRMMTAISATGEAEVTSLEKLDVGDLLGRKEIALNPAVMATYITGKVVMVTGGGGSIGSELCRQIMRFEPTLLVIFDMYENNAYDLEQELKVRYPALANRIVPRIGSVQDKKRLDAVFEEFKPSVLFHAAAYKHVPLMEECPHLAIENNVFGTYNTASCALAHGVRRFVMISTDKAVNPTNVMGASKRLAELVIQSLNGQGTEFVAVRFGNVLGSNGSVVPLFRRQIEAGGPVQVTHPDIIRYFMTIPEAARLVLQAGARAKGGETFILDMGEPVKIIDLARSMIELAGLEPDKDIPIVFTGLRPGEKLYEELLLDAEGAQKTDDEKIYVAHCTPLSSQERNAMLDALRHCIDSGADVRTCIKQFVPSYAPQK